VIQGKVFLSGRITEALMLILCGLAVFSVIRSRQDFMARGILDVFSLLFNTYISPFFIFLVAKDFINEEEKIRKLFILLSVILLYLSLTAIFEHFRIYSLVFPKDILNPRLGINFGRARGPFLAASINGMVLGMLAILNFYMAMNSKMPQKFFFIVNIFLSIIAVFFTYTRASWLGIVISFTFMILINQRFRKYFGIIVLLGIVFIAPLYAKIIDVEKVISRINSKGPVDNRISLYHIYLDMIKKKPIVGIGFANFNNCVEEYSSAKATTDVITHENITIHDTFFGIFVELGGLGLIVFLSILTSIFWKSFILFKHLGEGFLGKSIVIVFWGVGIVYLFNLFFIDMKFHQIQNVIFYMTTGIILGLYKRRIGHE
jgi:O-antigen ligase